MAQDDNEDLYDSTNSLISAIKKHESRIPRLEEKQDQLDILASKVDLFGRFLPKILVFLDLKVTPLLASHPSY